MVKAIFFDIDGTLVSFKTHKVSIDVLEALEKLRSKRIKLFIATGRHKLEINQFNDFIFDGYVTLNGQYCFTLEKVLYKNPIDKDAVEKIISFSENTENAYMLFGENLVGINKINQRVEDTLKQLKIENFKIGDLHSFIEMDVFQMISFTPSEEENTLKREFPNCDFTRWNPLFVDLNPKGGNKKAGILKILDYFNISTNEIMALGDGENDISMLELAKYSIAMGNASDLVKSKANYITDDVDNHGVIKALQHFNIL